MKYYAKVRFFSHEEGGRFNPPKTGFKPHLQVGDEFTSCVVTTVDTSIETMEFGNLYDVLIELVYPDIYSHKITNDMNVKLYEGSKLIGTGEFINL